MAFNLPEDCQRQFEARAVNCVQFPTRMNEPGTDALFYRHPREIPPLPPPSLKTLHGVTKAKKQIKKDLGITALLKPFRWWPNQKRRIKRKLGYESEVGRLVRDGLPKPGGCLVVLGMIVAISSWAVLSVVVFVHKFVQK